VERSSVRRRAARAVQRGVVYVVAGFVVCVCRAARADDLFEIDVFHVRVNEPMQFGTELHSNYVVAGAAREAPELSPNRVLYELVEPTFGVAKGWEVGAHLQQAVRPTGLDWGGARLRTMLIVPTAEAFPVKLAVNVEGGYTPSEYNPNTWDLEVRPVAEWRWSSFDIDVNPIVDITFTGPSAGIPQLNPAAALRYTVLGSLDLGLEYYASLGPVNGLSPVAKQGHYLFESLDLVRWPFWRVRAGLGEGLTAWSNPLTVTTILGHFF
jgi:hypothetical protein